MLPRVTCPPGYPANPKAQTQPFPPSIYALDKGGGQVSLVPPSPLLAPCQCIEFDFEYFGCVRMLWALSLSGDMEQIFLSFCGDYKASAA